MKGFRLAIVLLLLAVSMSMAMISNACFFDAHSDCLVPSFFEQSGVYRHSFPVAIQGVCCESVAKREFPERCCCEKTGQVVHDEAIATISSTEQKDLPSRERVVYLPRILEREYLTPVSLPSWLVRKTSSFALTVVQTTVLLI